MTKSRGFSATPATPACTPKHPRPDHEPFQALSGISNLYTVQIDPTLPPNPRARQSLIQSIEIIVNVKLNK
jgi:hypothetical protein